jgi:hypothetical protein
MAVQIARGRPYQAADLVAIAFGIPEIEMSMGRRREIVDQQQKHRRISPSQKIVHVGIALRR